jgi:manganese/iron transport system ATP-binding protein
LKATTPMLSIKNLKIGYAKKSLLNSFSLDVQYGDFLSIVGSNGSGKTTLIRTLLKLIEPVAGKIVRDTNLTFGYVPQSRKTNLNFPLTVEQVVMHGRVKKMGLFKTPTKNDLQIVKQCLEDLNILPLSSKLINTLSGGQYQRMLIARALASEPNCVVFDEPTTGMDIVAEHSFLELVQTLREKFKLSVIMVTHDLESAALVSNTLLIINAQEQSVIAGTPFEILTSKNLTSLFHQPLEVSEIDGRLIFKVGQKEPTK